jgi:quercetin dioxygenase-like cupin family protein
MRRSIFSDTTRRKTMTSTTPELPAIPGSMPFIHNLDTAPAYWWLDILWVVLVHGDDTGGRYSLMHETLPKGSGAPPHKHTWSDEHFYILEGSLTFLVGDEIREGHKGDFVFVPRNTRHAFRVDSETAVFLNGYTPAGLERAVTELAMPAPSRTIPPKNATHMPKMTPDDYRRYGMDNLPGPNPLASDKPLEGT